MPKLKLNSENSSTLRWIIYVGVWVWVLEGGECEGQHRVVVWGCDGVRYDGRFCTFESEESTKYLYIILIFVIPS